MSGRAVLLDLAAPPAGEDTDRETHPVGKTMATPRADGASATPACASCHALVIRHANFCHNCGTRLEAVAVAGDATLGVRVERRHVTIVFCDLVNSVALSAGRDPEDVAEAMRHYYGSLAAVMTKFGGNWERPIGDGALFYFGYPVAGEDDCERAVAAALAAIDAVNAIPFQLGTRLQVRVGVSTGEVVIGDLLSDPARRTLDVVGDVANLAARLQQVAAPDCVLVTDPVRQLTRNCFEFEDHGNVRLRGWVDATRLWRAVRRVRTGNRFERRIAAGGSPMVGRAEELAALGAAWDQASSGAGRTVLLTGQPGIGKSRLVHELTTGPSVAGASIIRYVCAPMQQEAALHPIIEQIAESAGLTAQDDPPARLAKLRTALADSPSADAALIAGLIIPERAADSGVVGRALPERRQERILSALLFRLLLLAGRGPLMIIVDDAHWSDPMTRALLARIAAAAPGHAMLLVVATRPQFRPGWAELPHICKIQLDPLPPRDSERLVRAAAGPQHLTDDVVADIVERSDGVPLFLEEVTRAMVESGVSDPDVPASIQASLLSRVDQLGRARVVAEVAATIGRAFDVMLLAAVCDTTPACLAHDLGKLIDAGLVRLEDASRRTVYVFRHALLRDATYGTIVRRRRRALHGRIAETLERDFPTEAAAHPQQLALHYAAGGLDEKAASWWLRAALQASQRSAMNEALTQASRALALLEALPDSADRRKLMLEVLLVQGRALMETEGAAAESTRAALARARALCEQMDDAPRLLAILFSEWSLSFFSCCLLSAEAQGSDLLRHARQRGDEIWLSMGCYTLGLTRLLRGDIRDSADLLQQATALFDPARAGARSRVAGGNNVVARSFLGWGAMMCGKFSEAAHELAATVTEARAFGQRYSIALAVHTRCGVILEMYGPAAAEPLLAEYEAAAAGIEHFEAFGEIVRGWLLGRRGDVTAGLEWCRRGRHRHAAAGTRLNHAYSLWQEAQMLLGLGRVQEALDELAAAKQLQAETGEQWGDAELHRVRAEALTALSRLDAAEAELIAAEQVARHRGQHLFLLRASTARARLLIRRGHTGDARLLLTQALTLVEPDAAVLDVAAAAALLAHARARP